MDAIYSARYAGRAGQVTCPDPVLHKEQHQVDLHPLHSPDSRSQQVGGHDGGNRDQRKGTRSRALAPEKYPY